MERQEESEALGRGGGVRLGFCEIREETGEGAYPRRWEEGHGDREGVRDTRYFFRGPTCPPREVQDGEPSLDHQQQSQDKCLSPPFSLLPLSVSLPH